MPLWKGGRQLTVGCARIVSEESPLQRHLISWKTSFTSGMVQVALGILQRIGFQDIVCAADGVAALAEISARGGGDSFDIVLTDLHMPRKVRPRDATRLNL